MKMWGKITYPFPIVANTDWAYDYLSILGSKLNHINKRGRSYAKYSPVNGTQADDIGWHYDWLEELIIVLCLTRVPPRHNSGPVFYVLFWTPSHLKHFLQVAWPFSIFTSSDLEAKSLGEVLHNMVCYTIYLQKVARIIFIDELGFRCHGLRQHRRHRGLLWC